MFAFLVKKIGMINNGRVSTIAWNHDEDWIAIGGDHLPQGQRKGLLKIIRLDEQRAALQGQQARLPYENHLEQHGGKVTTIVWNERYQKLTTSDEQGLIIVWTFIQDEQEWCEEMINNRQKSVVTDLKWSPDGTKIGIVYEDGAVIIGSIDGARLWGRDYSFRLAIIEWSPDSKLLLFGTTDGQVLIHDQQGNPLHQLRMSCLINLVEPKNYLQPNQPLAAVQWYELSKMFTEETPPGLLIAYQCGRIQLMKNELDEAPVLIDTVMTISCVRWVPNGSLFAVGGCAKEKDETRAVVQFYNNNGDHLRTLRVQNSDRVSCMSFEGDGLRLIMGVEKSVFVANLKLDYKWCVLQDTVVFAYQKQNRTEFAVVFWDTKRDQKNIRYLRGLQSIRGVNDACVLICAIDNETWKLELCNSIGSPLDTKLVNIEPKYTCMTKTHVIVCNSDFVYLWQYRNQVQRLTTFENSNQAGIRKIGREMAWFIDDSPDSSVIYDKETFNLEQQTEEQITAVCANESYLFIGRINGNVLKYTLPHVSAEPKYFVDGRPQIININCNSTRLSIIDIQGTISILDTTVPQGKSLDFDKKECWLVVWSDNDPLTFAVMEKGRLHIVRDVIADDPIPTDAFPYAFSDLAVKAALLDDIMLSPDGALKQEDLLVCFESRTIKELKESIKKTTPREMFKIIEKQPSNTLWTLLAYKAMEEYEFYVAEMCFLKLEDYSGLQFLKRISSFDDKERQRAEILAYQRRFDEAEAVLKGIERKDLAVQMRLKIGDYSRVIHLSKDVAGQDEMLYRTHNELGKQYFDQGDWERAAEQFRLANNIQGLVESSFNAEDYQTVEKIVDELQEGNVLLQDLGERFQLIGMAKSAIKCFEKFGDVKRAIDCAVLLNAWNFAVELAERHNFVQIEGLLQQYAAQLLEQRMKLEAAELYRKANHNSEAAKLLQGIGEDLVRTEASPQIVKKLFVMAALEVDLYKKKLYDVTMTAQNNTIAHTLDQLVTNDLQHSAEKVLNNPWRQAEAWHFYLLTQKFLYSGQFKNAMKSAIRLTEFELDMDPKKIYSLLALAAYYNRSFKYCAKAFVKLENLEGLTDEEKERYQSLAAQIFVKYPPDDSPCESVQCPKPACSNKKVTEYSLFCPDCGTIFGACVASGISIYGQKFYTCRACKHKMIDQEVINQSLKFCALCHTAIDFTRFGKHSQDKQ